MANFINYIPEVLKDTKFTLDVPESMRIIISPQVIKAISIVNKIIYNLNSCKQIFKELSIVFVNDITDKELEEIIIEYIHLKGCDVFFDKIYLVKKYNRSALMQSIPWPNSHSKALNRPIIILMHFLQVEILEIGNAIFIL